MYRSEGVGVGLDLVEHFADAGHGDEAHVLDLLHVELVLGVVDRGAEKKVIQAVDLDSNRAHQMQFLIRNQPVWQFVRDLQFQSPVS